jgi:exopolyphosphatase/guanosine-5'-triphosphate,3'-diphosphate pyrophosphatase
MNHSRRASIDIGSNSILLLIADVNGGQLKEVLKRTEVTGLGKNLDAQKAFMDETMDSSLEVLISYAEDCKTHGVPVESVLVTATEAARVAKNAKDFFNKVEKQTGLIPKIINSQAEAYFSTKGILFNTNFDSDIVVIMDVGGASTELIKVNAKTFQILETISMPIGAVRSSEALANDLFVQKLQKTFLDFRQDLDHFQTHTLHCVAGTVTSLGNMHLKNKEFVEDEVHGLKLKVEDVDVLFKSYSNWTAEQFLGEFPFLQKRSQAIRGGLHLVYHLLHRLLVKEVIVSTYGLRYGTILEGKIKEEYLYDDRK